MKLSKEQKIYAAVLGVAVMALTVDNFFLGSDRAGPSMASASVAVMAGSAAAPANPASAAPATAAGPTVSVAEQLQALDERLKLSGGEVRNAFEPWKTAADAPPPVAASTAAAAAVVEKFQKDHQLTGVMSTGATAYAIIDGGTVAIGRSLDGFKLLSVTQRSATLVGLDGERVELKIEDRAVAHRAAQAR